MRWPTSIGYPYALGEGQERIVAFWETPKVNFWTTPMTFGEGQLQKRVFCFLSRFRPRLPPHLRLLRNIATPPPFLRARGAAAAWFLLRLTTSENAAISPQPVTGTSSLRPVWAHGAKGLYVRPRGSAELGGLQSRCRTGT